MKKNSFDKRVFRNSTYFNSMAWLDVTYDEYLEMCEENGLEPKKEGSYEQINEVIKYMNDDFGDFNANLKYSKWNVPCMITGSLGLWNGNPTIVPVLCNNLVEAVDKCIGGSCDDVEVKLENGHIEVYAKHHDGTNCFEIHILSKKGLREVERPIYKYEKDFEPKPYWFKNIYGYLF